eukprot:scaffold24525_cov162-Cylindrotheca_fusiformis.AAC.1
MGCTQSSGAAKLQNDELVATFLEPPKQEEFTKSEPSFKTIPSAGSPPPPAARRPQGSPYSTPPPPRQKPQSQPNSGSTQHTYRPPFDSGTKPQHTYKPPISSEQLSTPTSADKPIRRTSYQSPAQTASKSPRTNVRYSREVSASKPSEQARPAPRKPQPEDSNDEASTADHISAGPSRPIVPQRKVREESVYVEEAKKGQTFEDVYLAGKVLGDGAFSKVVLGRHKRTGQEFAVKIIDRSKMHWGGRDALEDEIQNMRKLREAPCVVKYQDVFYEEARCFLVVELLPGGELFGRIIQKGTFSEKEARDASKCVLSALDYMHERRVAHRDMKPENLLLVDAVAINQVKLSDFGFAKTVDKKNSCRTLCGTPGYLAPEILERWPAYDVVCDMWGFGVILFLLLGGYLPFDPSASNDVNAVFERTRNGEYYFYPQRWQNISKMAKDLVARCLNINPNKRITSRKALQHPWIQAGEASLSVTQIDTTKLKSVVKERQHIKKTKHRVKDLNDDFTVFLDKRKADSIVSHMTGAHKTIATAATAFKEEGNSGRPIGTFYKKGERLGKGAFAVVYRSRHNRTGLTYAIKEIDLSRLKPKELKTLQDEINVLKFLRGGPEMKGGDLLNRILEKEVYTENEARDCCRHIFEAVKYCHGKRIAHRDIKLDNLLLVEKNNEATLKLADFGFSKKCKKRGLTTMCGTPNYMAPEVFELPPNGYDFRCDMWSVGVVVYCLLGGYLPFEGDLKDIKRKALSAKYKFHREYWESVSIPAKEMIARLLQTNPDRRLTAEQALRCEWMGLDEDQLTINDLSRAQDKIKKSDKLKTLNKQVIDSNADASSGKASETKDDEEEEKFIENYELLQQIGHGEFAEIHIAIHRLSNSEVAVKKVCRRNLIPSDVIALDDEISVMRALADSRHVIRFKEVYEDPDYTFIVMERVYGTVLIEELVKKKRYTEFDAKEVIRNLLLGVHYCHSKRIAIRNLKLESLLLPDDNPKDVRITDFECAKVVAFPNSLHTQCGTQEYVAPEVLENKPAYDVSCDMWTIGVIVFIMLGGYYPFRAKKEIDVLKKVRYGEFKFHEKFWKDISEDAKSLVRQLMTVDPEQRISASDALKSSWIYSDSLVLKTDLSPNMGSLGNEFSQLSTRSNNAAQLVMAMNKQNTGDVRED